MADAKHTLPDVLPGHWDTPEGGHLARANFAVPRTKLALGQYSDFAFANMVFMAERNSIDLVPLQSAAKERIRWLSVQLAIAMALVSTAYDVLAEPSEMSPNSTAWFQRAEQLLKTHGAA